MSPRLIVGARSDVGLQRRNNQDSLYAGPHLVAVADGVGGAAGGEVASRLTIAALQPLDDDASPDPGSALRAAADRADNAIRDSVAREPSLSGMGTTLSAILATADALTLAHIGDSRVYRLRAGALTQLTADHTFVQTLLDQGQITEDEALTHPRRNWILRALDGRGNPELNVATLETEPGDRYLVCSDGLSTYVAEAAIADGLAGGGPQDAADRLLDLALRAGGTDNISCAVADLATDESPAQDPIVAGAIAEAPAQPATSPHSDSHATQAMSLPAARDATIEDKADHESNDEIPTRRKRSIGRRLTALVLIVVVLIVVAVAGVFIEIRHRYYVAPSRGRVAIFRGVKGKPLGHKLHSLEYVTNIPVSALPQANLDSISGGYDASSRQKANAIVANLRRQACPSPAPTTSSKKAAPVTPAWCTGIS